MKQKPFSIITPTYNCGKKLEKTIESVLAQDNSSFEYIIVDGGSTDSTLSVIKKYGDKLKLRSEADEGLYDAMNKGIDMASGKYLYFLGAGDCLRENILEKIEEVLPEGELNFVYGNVYLMNYGTEHGWEFTKADLTKKVNIGHQAIFYERSIFDLLGRYELKYKWHADFAFNLKCFGNREIKKKYINCVIADYEGDGHSERQLDEAFSRDFAWLIISRLGIKEYVLHGDTFINRFALRLINSLRYRITRHILPLV